MKQKQIIFRSRFTAEELNRLANIFDNAGQVFLGVMVLTPLVSGIDRNKILMIIWGLVGTILCWLFSLRLTRKAKE